MNYSQAMDYFEPLTELEDQDLSRMCKAFFRMNITGLFQDFDSPDAPNEITIPELFNDFLAINITKMDFAKRFPKLND